MTEQLSSEIEAGLKTTHKARYTPEEMESFDVGFNVLYEAVVNCGYTPGSHIRAIVVDLDKATCDHSELSAAFKALNNRRVFVIEQGRFMVSFFFSNGSRDFISLSHDRLMTTLEEGIHQPFGILCGISQTFEDLREASNAFKQALYSIEYRKYYLREIEITREDVGIDTIAGTSFAQVLPYYLVEESSTDESYVGFCLSRAFLTSILADDIRHNTKNFQILWFYLAFERNASLVGRRMFMHRNSVLYHIKQMEKQYDFDLDCRFFREKLLLDYRLVLMSLSDASISALFDD